MSHRALLALGSNLGDRLNNLQQALSLLAQEPEISLVKVSHFYETEPLGMRVDDPAKSFINVVAMVETALSPEKLLAACLKIEHALGRKRNTEDEPREGYCSRTLDLDILFYDMLIIREAGLEIPHPRLHERTFVLIPLVEIAPDWVHPILGQTIQQLTMMHPETETVQRLSESFCTSKKTS